MNDPLIVEAQLAARDAEIYRLRKYNETKSIMLQAEVNANIGLRAENTRLTAEIAARLYAMELAWGLIANSYGGDWQLANDDWKQAAVRWRDEHWHPALQDKADG